MGLYSLTMSKEGKAHFIILFFISHRLLNPLNFYPLILSLMTIRLIHSYC